MVISLNRYFYGRFEAVNPNKPLTLPDPIRSVVSLSVQRQVSELSRRWRTVIELLLFGLNGRRGAGPTWSALRPLPAAEPKIVLNGRFSIP